MLISYGTSANKRVKNYGIVREMAILKIPIAFLENGGVLFLETGQKFVKYFYAFDFRFTY